MKKLAIFSTLIAMSLLTACSDPCTKLADYDVKAIKADCKGKGRECLVDVEKKFAQLKDTCDAHLAKLDKSEVERRCKETNVDRTNTCKDLRHGLEYKYKASNEDHDVDIEDENNAIPVPSPEQKKEAVPTEVEAPAPAKAPENPVPEVDSLETQALLIADQLLSKTIHEIGLEEGKSVGQFFSIKSALKPCKKSPEKCSDTIRPLVDESFVKYERGIIATILLLNHDIILDINNEIMYTHLNFGGRIDGNGSKNDYINRC